MSDEQPPKSSNVVSLEHLIDRHVKPAVRFVDRPGYCLCSLLVVSEHEKTVTCDQCGKIYEPFEAVVHLMKHWKHFGTNLAMMRAEARRYDEIVKNLRDEIRSLKSKRRRLDPPSTPPPNAMVKFSAAGAKCSPAPKRPRRKLTRRKLAKVTPLRRE